MKSHSRMDAMEGLSLKTMSVLVNLIVEKVLTPEERERYYENAGLTV